MTKKEILKKFHNLRKLEENTPKAARAGLTSGNIRDWGSGDCALPISWGEEEEKATLTGLTSLPPWPFLVGGAV